MARRKKRVETTNGGLAGFKSEDGEAWSESATLYRPHDLRGGRSGEGFWLAGGSGILGVLAACHEHTGFM